MSLFWPYGCLILLSGDIELNPGPYSVDGSADTSDILSSTSFYSLTNHLSILHLNIQSILPKIDLIRGEATSYDILIFSESWLKPIVNNHEIHIENVMPPFRTDRNDRLLQIDFVMADSAGPDEIPTFVGVLCWSLFCNPLHRVLSSFAIILTRKRELVPFILFVLLMSCYC